MTSGCQLPSTQLVSSAGLATLTLQLVTGQGCGFLIMTDGEAHRDLDPISLLPAICGRGPLR
jgi:hypothetical protein